MVRTSHKKPNTWVSSLIVLLAFLAENASANKEGYYGKYIGKLSQLHHGVSGDVFAVDARTLHLRNFNYDGEGPAAYFYAGNSKAPGSSGFRLRDERGTTNVLPKYRNKHITVTLPEGKTLQNIKWFSVWCDEFSVNFGDVKIPKNFDFPKPQKISGLHGVHGVSSEPIVIVDAQTLLVPSFSYDGEAPDAKFWVGPGAKPTPQGIRIPDENGKEAPLRRYDRKTIVLTLPGELTIFDIGHFGVWCEAFTVDFGHIQIPRGLNIPPSLKMLGVSPQSKLNCEVLWDDFAYEVRWAVAGDSIVLQLVARLEDNEYMSFGLSGEKGRSRMVGGDVVVAWVDKESLKGYAEDYYLDGKSQCSGGRGSCPDEKISAGAGNVRLLNAALVNGYSIVTFQRSLRAQDELDGNVLTNGSQPIIWAIGPLNSRKEVSYHSLTNRGDVFIDFGRAPKWNCPTPESATDDSESEEESHTNLDTEFKDRRPQEVKRENPQTKVQVPTPAPVKKSSNAWEIPPIKCDEPEDGVFYAQLGPTGGKHGYSAITGHVGWGISWYINGLLIPEINVVRGRTYTFIVEGGLDPEIPAKYHPFYITDDPVGGYQYKTPEERLNIQIFAGAVQNKKGEVRPTGIGRLCNWTPDPNQPSADDFSSFGAYQRTLRLECDPGNPGIIQWTVDKDTPDTVYYQCYTHRYLGWKINVHDTCENDSGASEPIPTIVKPPKDFDPADYEGEETVNYEVKVKPSSAFLQTINQTFVQGNLFPSGVKHENLIKGHFGEKAHAKGEATIVKNHFGLKQVYAADRLKESQAAVARPTTQSVNSEVSILLKQQQQQQQKPQPHLYLKTPLSLVQDVKPNLFSTLNQSPGLSMYSVTEVPLEDGRMGQQVFQNFQILPASSLHGSNTEIQKFAIPFAYVNDKAKDTKTGGNAAFPTFLISDQTVNGGQLEKELHRNYQLLRIQAEEKLKKQNSKFEIRGKLPHPPRHGPASSSNWLKKPSSVHGAFTLQQRPLPPGPFRSSPGGKPGKRPSGQSAVATYVKAHPLGHRFKSEPENDALKKNQNGGSFALFGPAALKKPTSGTHPGATHFAQNTGFDPETVKVEGGFKPILNSASVAAPSAIKRADVDIDEEDGSSYPEGESFTAKLQEVTEEDTEDSGSKDVNLFKNQKPQMFEPIFIPSVPDHSMKKLQEEKHRGRKKPTDNPKLRYDYPEKFRGGGGSIHVRMRPNFNLVRRPLYPDNLLPPFKIPSRRFGPKFRQQEEDVDEVELSEDELVGNQTQSQAGNILEVLEMEDNADQTTATDQDEIAMADENKEMFLPDRFLSYDGKLVSAQQVPNLPGSDVELDVSRLPQHVPYQGAIPPLRLTFDAQNLPQLKSTVTAKEAILPPTGEPAAIEMEQNNHKAEDLVGDGRSKRSADHEPHHHGHDHHHGHGDHEHHEHHEHHEDHVRFNGAATAKTSSSKFLALCSSLLLFIAMAN